MREPLLFLCLAHLRAGSWQRLQGCLVLLLLATVWVPYQVQVPRERCLGLAPLLRVESGLGSATSGVIAIDQKVYARQGQDLLFWARLWYYMPGACFVQS